MFSSIWHNFFFDPVYNALVFFIDVIPGGDIGLAIIATTILVKLFLLPLSIKAAKTQVVMREIEPKLKELKEKVTDKQEQAKQMMEIYKEAGVNPFASIIQLFLQIPIIIALYLSVMSLLGYTEAGEVFVKFNEEIIYAFLAVPNAEFVTTMMLGFVDIAAKSLPLALLAGLTQFLHARLAMPKPEPKKDGEAPDLKADFARSMNTQMRYVMPLIITVVAYSISASIAIYFTVSNLMAIGQEYVVRKHRK